MKVVIVKKEMDENNGREATNYAKFRLLMWKNILVQYRHPFITVSEFIVSIFFILALVSLRGYVPSLLVTEPTFYHGIYDNGGLEFLT